MRSAVCVVGLVVTQFCAAQQVSLFISAYTDGRDRLVIQGNTVHWDHFDYNLPGREDGGHFPTRFMWEVDGVPVGSAAWQPRWTRVNGMWQSDTHVVKFPNLGKSPIQFVAVAARNSMSLWQSPTEDNNYQTIIEFNDDVTFGAAWYTAAVTYESTEKRPIRHRWPWSRWHW